MQRQNLIKTQDRHVWIILGALALCLVVLGFMPGLQPANARLAGYYPKPGMPGFPPPPNFAGHPGVALFRPGIPPERHPGLPAFKARFVNYRHVGGTSLLQAQLTHVPVPLTRTIDISTPVNLSEHNEHLWLENAQTSLSENTHARLRPPVPEMHRHGHLVPPPDGLWSHARLLLRGQFAEFSQDKRPIQDRVEAYGIKTIPQHQSNEGQNSLAQQSHIPKNRLQSLQVLRL